MRDAHVEPQDWSTSRVVTFLGLMTIAVLLLDPLVRLLFRLGIPLRPVLELTGHANEGNIPTWWNTLLLGLLAGLLLYAGSHWVDTVRMRRSCHGLAAVATYLSLDEATGLHERIGPVAQYIMDENGWSVPTYAWVVPGAVLGLLGLAVIAWLALGLPRRPRRLLVGGFVIYLAGAVGLEAAAGFLRRADERLLYYLATMFEEGFEMGGVIVACLAPLYLRDQWMRRQPEAPQSEALVGDRLD